MSLAFIYGLVGGLSGAFYAARADEEGASILAAVGVFFLVVWTWPLVLALHVVARTAR